LLAEFDGPLIDDLPDFRRRGRNHGVVGGWADDGGRGGHGLDRMVTM
jgi:hypothetical protein